MPPPMRMFRTAQALEHRLQSDDGVVLLGGGGAPLRWGGAGGTGP
jgi:hypothetical protein